MSTATLPAPAAYAAAVSATACAMGWPLDTAAWALEPRGEGECGWLLGCREAAADGDWLCAGHHAEITRRAVRR